MWPNGMGWNPYQPYAQQHKIPSGAGREGVLQIQIGPNSEELALDTMGPFLYHIKSDSLGKVQIIGEYTIAQREPEPDRLDMIEAQLQKIMEMMKHE